MCNSEGGVGAEAIYFLTSGKLTSFGYKVLSAHIHVPGIPCSMRLMCLSIFISYRDNIDNFSLVSGAREMNVQVLKDGSVKIDMRSPMLKASLVPTAGVLGTWVDMIIPYNIVFAGGKATTGNLKAALVRASMTIDQLIRMRIPQTSILILRAETYVYGDIQSRSEVKMDMWDFDIVDYLGEATCALVVALLIENLVLFVSHEEGQ
ncbi:diaminopimelate epimerase, chloroplastic-like [Lotus japonicus]|uniref:diaminopimelate epimerase, chloroplastic-like n=1 Tax=Lotus japonicus TaxID=34305 RepID=UPI00258ABF32|nr:diaminopimelate epimerase, chloroplastic-like [Lotus japonicus]